MPTVSEVDVYRQAAAFAQELDHHLFETLYHAVAVETGAVLVTADERYWRKARHLTGIVTLAGWERAIAGVEREQG